MYKLCTTLVRDEKPLFFSTRASTTGMLSDSPASGLPCCSQDAHTSTASDNLSVTRPVACDECAGSRLAAAAMIDMCAQATTPTPGLRRCAQSNRAKSLTALCAMRHQSVHTVSAQYRMHSRLCSAGMDEPVSKFECTLWSRRLYRLTAVVRLCYYGVCCVLLVRRAAFVRSRCVARRVPVMHREESQFGCSC